MAIVSLVASNSPPAIEALLEAGIPIMAEKPACVDPEDFAPLARLADEKGVPLMLALANRMRPDMGDARRIIAEGGIGELYAVRAVQVADQTRIQELTEPDWTFERARGGGGHLVWLGIHFVDLIRYVTGCDIEQVQALTGVVGGAPIDVEDLALVNMRLSGGALVSLFSGYLMEEKGHQGLDDLRLAGLAANRRRRVAEADVVLGPRRRRQGAAHALRGPRRALYQLGGPDAARLPGRDRAAALGRRRPGGAARGARGVRFGRARRT